MTISIRITHASGAPTRNASTPINSRSIVRNHGSVDVGACSPGDEFWLGSVKASHLHVGNGSNPAPDPSRTLERTLEVLIVEVVPVAGPHRHERCVDRPQCDIRCRLDSRMRHRADARLRALASNSSSEGKSGLVESMLTDTTSSSRFGVAGLGSGL